MIALMPTAVFLLVACDRPDPEGPPSIAYGSDACAECNMIISDQRRATATVVRGPRGPEPLLFDDFNCQVDHEAARPKLDIIGRWSHDHGSLEARRCHAARFVPSPEIRSPMGSHAAAFASQTAAERAADRLGGSVTTYEQAREALLEDRHADQPDSEKPK